MTPPLPDRIAAAIKQFDLSAMAFGIGLDESRAELNAAIAEVVAERDAQRADAVRCSDEIYRALLAIVPEAKGNLGQLAEAVRVKCDAATKRADGLAAENAAQLAAGKALYEAAEKARADLATAQAKLAEADALVVSWRTTKRLGEEFINDNGGDCIAYGDSWATHFCADQLGKVLGSAAAEQGGAP